MNFKSCKYKLLIWYLSELQPKICDANRNRCNLYNRLDESAILLSVNENPQEKRRNCYFDHNVFNKFVACSHPSGVGQRR